MLKSIRFAIIALPMLLLMTISPQLSPYPIETRAQQKAPYQVEYLIEGQITKINSNLVTLANQGMVFDISKATVFSTYLTRRPGGYFDYVVGHVPASKLTEGTYVTARGDQPVFNNNLLSPSSISIQSPPDRATIIGNIEAIDLATRTITVLGQQIVISEKSVLRMSDRQHDPITLEDLKVGYGVNLTLEIQSVGISVFVLYAHLQPFRGAAIFGPITKISNNKLQLINNQFEFDISQIEIKSFLQQSIDCPTIPTAQINPGIRADIQLHNLKPGETIADKITSVSVCLTEQGKIEGRPEDVNLQEQSFKIAGQKIYFNAVSIIRDKERKVRISLAELVAAEKVHVNYQVKEGRLIAKFAVPMIATQLQQTLGTPCNMEQ